MLGLKRADLRYLLLSFLLINSSAIAADKGLLLIGGNELSESNTYSYFGVLKPLNGSKIGEGPFSKFIVSLLTYNYDVDHQGVKYENVLAIAPGIEAGGGYAWTGDVYALSLGLSAGYRYIYLSPNLSNGDAQGDTFTITPDVQARFMFTQSLDFDLISNYAFGQKSSFNRQRFGWHPVPNWRVGLEAVKLRGENYSSSKLGIFGSTYFSKGLGLEFSAGVAHNDETDSPYIGAGFSKFF